MSKSDIQALETQIYELSLKLHEMRKANTDLEDVRNYGFATLSGETTLLDLFAGRNQLLVIHNMGQGCRYCTLWADGLNGVLDHLESALSVVLVSKDAPELQRRFANARGWRFRLASHGGGDYMSEQSVIAGQGNMPGAVVYERDGERIVRRDSCAFGPGDLYSPVWHLLALAGIGEGADGFTPQYSYWLRPQKLDDGGDNVLG